MDFPDFLVCCGRNDGRKIIKCSVSDVSVWRIQVANNEAVQENFKLVVSSLPAFLPLIKKINLSHRNVTDMSGNCWSSSGDLRTGVNTLKMMAAVSAVVSAIIYIFTVVATWTWQTICSNLTPYLRLVAKVMSASPDDAKYRAAIMVSKLKMSIISLSLLYSIHHTIKHRTALWSEGVDANPMNYRQQYKHNLANFSHIQMLQTSLAQRAHK